MEVKLGAKWTVTVRIAVTTIVSAVVTLTFDGWMTPSDNCEVIETRSIARGSSIDAIESAGFMTEILVMGFVEEVVLLVRRDDCITADVASRVLFAWFGGREIPVERIDDAE